MGFQGLDICRHLETQTLNPKMHAQEVQRKVGFQGLDIYSLAASSDAVIKFLEEMDPAAAQRARGRYGCFDM